MDPKREGKRKLVRDVEKEINKSRLSMNIHGQLSEIFDEVLVGFTSVQISIFFKVNRYWTELIKDLSICRSTSSRSEPP